MQLKAADCLNLFQMKLVCFIGLFFVHVAKAQIKVLANTADQTGTVVKIIDGDTFDLLT